MLKSFKPLIRTFDLKFKTRKQTLKLVLLALIFFNITGCHIPISKKKPDPKLFENIKNFSTESVVIQFQLTATNSNFKTKKIVLEILDDVTGLPYNSSSIELKPLTEQIFFTSLTVPKGSVIKYRYVKIETSFAIPEVTISEDPIHYRLFYASNNAIITDIFQCWQDGCGENTFGGIVEGVLHDKDTGQPIPDILVAAGGKLTFTDANGKYFLDDLGQGVHNMVFYAIDGKYHTYQQGATIEPGMKTLANVYLNSMPRVNVTFIVKQPNDELEAPVYIAGNIQQLGNTFASLNGGMSIKPNRMPMLSPNKDNTQLITLPLYAETDLRYKFTLGDGYWNSEQYQKGGFKTHQLIVPSEDVTINHTIETWRSPGIEPIELSISFPSDSPFNGNKFIQFKTDTWTEPIPLWSVESGESSFILISPLIKNQPIEYRICYMEDCSQIADAGLTIDDRSITPTQNAQKIDITVNEWENLPIFRKDELVQEAYIPQKHASFLTAIELSPEMSPSWMINIPNALPELNQIGASTLIFSPQWVFSPNLPYLHPQIGLTPYSYELLSISEASKASGLSIRLFPQIGLSNQIAEWWHSKPHTEAWWNEFFASYQDFILNYAKFSEISKAEALLLGGKALTPAFEGGFFPDGNDSDIPAGFDAHWYDLIKEIRKVYSGKLIWVTQINHQPDPLPRFLGEFDGIYISIDGPLSISENPSFETIQSGFIHIIDNQIYEIYRSQLLPITLALGYPSVSQAANGCALLNAACYNDGLFRGEDLYTYDIDFEIQSLIYNAIMPIIASRDWITGISIRGYDPIPVVYDGSSSIAGKPAFDVIQYWYTNLKP